MFLGFDITAWTAVLALVTVIALGVTIWLSVSERRRDDAKRRQDRDRDDQLRAEQQARDDRRRQEATDELERRVRAERRAREDYEARQVTVRVTRGGPQNGNEPGRHFNCRITVSAPHAYPIKQVEGCFAVVSNSALGTVSFGHGGDEPVVDENFVHYGFWAEAPETRPWPTPIIRWVDWHGNRYYQCRNYTERFGQNRDFREAAQAIDKWIRTGPKPD